MRGHLDGGVRATRTGYRRCVAAAFAAAIALSASVVHAQWQVDAYLGAPFFRGENVAVLGENPVPVRLFGSARDSGEVAAGLRVGYWWSLPAPIDFGVALDGSGVFGEFGNADFNFVPLSALLMARLRLMPSDAFPGGRLQPYIGAGPSLAWSNLDLGLFSDDRWDFGGDGRVGVRFGLIEQLGVFGEYRYTYFTPRYRDELFGLDTRARVHIDSIVHHANFGFSYAF